MNETTNLLASALFSGFRGDDATATTTEAKKDRFGQRVGSQAAAINAALTTEPQSLEAIAKASGQELGRVKNHLKFWLMEKRGLGLSLVKSDAGFAIKS